MSLDNKFAPVRTRFYHIVENFFQKVAGFFGYPENKGMPIDPNFKDKIYNRNVFLDSRPEHLTWPKTFNSETWFETIFGTSPKIESVPKYFYENGEDGFYSFYIEHYKNIFFLPDLVSEFLQVRLNICSDLTVLENIRETIFIGLVVYSQVITLRIMLSWFVSINPYNSPWRYLTATVDWADEILQGMFPTIFGVNLTGNVILGLLGTAADSLNHLVFTMPFLPSEGKESKLFLNQQLKDVIIFHDLPILWSRYPIPNEIRKFWYEERLDIFFYMLNTYKDSGIQILPDNILNS